MRGTETGLPRTAGIQGDNVNGHVDRIRDTIFRVAIISIPPVLLTSGGYGPEVEGHAGTNHRLRQTCQRAVLRQTRPEAEWAARSVVGHAYCVLPK